MIQGHAPKKLLIISPKKSKSSEFLRSVLFSRFSSHLQVLDVYIFGLGVRPNSHFVWNMCENLHYESVYFNELHNGVGASVLSTITSFYNNIRGRHKYAGENELNVPYAAF